MATLGPVEASERSLARPSRPVRRVVRGSDRRRGSRPGADGACHRDARRRPVGADGSAQGPRRARVRLLHEPREPQGRGARRTHEPRVSSTGSRSSARCASRGQSRSSPTTSRPRTSTRDREQPDRRLGLAAVAAGRGSGASSNAGLRRSSSGSRAETSLPLPPFWGGYRIVATTIEFWQGRPGRLHDRVQYALGSGGWTRQRLAP